MQDIIRQRLIFYTLTFITVFGVCASLCWYLISSQEAHLFDLGRVENLAVTRILANAMGDKLPAFIERSYGKTRSELIADPFYTEVNWYVWNLIEGSEIVKIKAFNQDGLTVFAMPPGDIGKIKEKSKYPGLAAAEEGEVSHQSSFRAEMATIFGNRRDLFVMSTYIPVVNNGGEVFAVMEVYSDFTEFYKTLTRQQWLYVGACTLAAILIYTMLILLNARSQRVLEHGSRMAREASRMKSEFLANMSHEIRTPMNGIYGTIQILSEDKLSPSQEKFVGVMRQSTENLMVIINDILDFSKIEAGKMTLELAQVDMAEVVKEVNTLFKPQAMEKGIRLLVQNRLADAGQVYADKVRTQQVISNFVSNAIKFTQEGSVTIVLTDALLKGAPAIRVQVRDTGVGIPPEQHARVFAQFEQADGSTTRKFGGTGLGLAISKNLVEMMNGEIGFDSAAGEGSTFWVTLPQGKSKA